MRSAFLFGAVLALALSSTANADIVFRIDLDVSTSEIDETIDVTVGQVIKAGVQFQVTETSLNGLGGVFTSILFDSDKFNLGPPELQINNPYPPFGTIGSNRHTTPPAEWSRISDDLTASENIEGGFAEPPSGLTVFYENTGAYLNASTASLVGGLGPGATVQYFQFTLEATQSGTITSVFDNNPSVVVAFARPGVDGLVDATMDANVIPLEQIVNVSVPVAVPEPSSLVFLSLGTMFVMHRRSRKPKKMPTATV